MSQEIKIEIETAPPDMQQRYLQFCQLFAGCRFMKNGVIRCKFEMFGAVERGEIDMLKLWSRKTEWEIISVNIKKK